MISSIVVTDTFKIEVNENGKFNMGDTVMNISDVPFVRYRFKQEKSVEEIISYIKSMMDKFPKSAHLYEIHTINEGTVELVEALEDTFTNLAKFAYIYVDDNMVLNKEIPEEIMDIISDINDDFTLDRIMLKDNSTTLDPINADRLRDKIAKELDYSINDIGVCSSPLSFGELCCLTAVKARELAAEYVEDSDFPLPTANHQSMNCCGCIRYYVFEADSTAPEVKNSKAKKVKSDNIMNAPEGDSDNNQEEKKKTVKKPKVAINMSRLNF